MQRENDGRFWDDSLYPCDEDLSSLLGSAWEVAKVYKNYARE